ncbi:hypothetical protein CRE_02707 [Caenorhabditis remanei]|uniref:PAN-3 domain-containing protein n=1 Tax=Caenorhabditis remanei TaxID=31234 RepID=E3NMI2_CAERE|nr:hypothetical protein CRE_02707 [Caenorhabditis remanei]
MMSKCIYGFFALVFIEIIQCDLLVFWGYPTVGTTFCVNITVVSFDNCKETCQKSLSCMLASGSGNNCMLCDIYTVSSIAKSTKEIGIKTAVKVNPIDGDKCTSDTDGTVFSGQHSENNTYTVTSTGQTWTISHAKKCKESSWRIFPRPFGPFCIGVRSRNHVRFLFSIHFQVANNTTPLSRNSAASACKSKWNIGLTALNSIAERNYVLGIVALTDFKTMCYLLESAREIIGKHSAYKYTSIWLNGALRADCDFVGSQNTAECSGMKAYEYIGDLITSLEAYKFAPGTPNYTKIEGSSQSCLQLMSSQSETTDNGLVKNAVYVSLIECSFGEKREIYFRCGSNCNEDNSICALSFVCGH